MQLPELPVLEALPALRRALAGHRSAVLVAPPGAGKTTVVPLALLDEPWLGGRKILVLEPRRLAARAAAARMAALAGGAVGGLVGLRIRLETRVGPETRIEVVTEGVLTRLLQADPSLEGIGLVMFDEFHERSLDADLGLALALEARAALREDLRILPMSATLDGAAVARLLGDAPVVESLGRAFPVETRYRPPGSGVRTEAAVASAIRRVLAEEAGSVLAFLPGEGEIRRVEALLAEGRLPADVEVAPLYGALAAGEQDRAIRPAPAGRRKVVLATTIAETSLTIEGVTIIVDSGLKRVSRFDPGSGMSRLETVRVSAASAAQRQGRAGRTAPGLCIRLWPEAGQRALLPFDAPEIATADLVPLALELAAWGADDPAALAWLDPPAAGPFAGARTLLADLGALREGGRITAHGRAMAELPMHPRLAHMVLAGRSLGAGRLAVDLAALLSERDPLVGVRDPDVRARLDLATGRGGVPAGAGVRRGALAAVRATRRLWAEQLRLSRADASPLSPGAVLALAFPDRVAQRRGGAVGQFRLSGGRGASLPETEPLAAADLLVVADLDAAGPDARIRSAAPVEQAELEAVLGERIVAESTVAWDARAEAVLARRRRRLGAVVLAEEPWADAPGEAVGSAMAAAVGSLGLAALPWTAAAEELRARVALMRRLEPDGWPDLSDEALAAGIGDWLGPWLAGMSRRADLARLDMARIVAAMLDPRQRQRLDREAPTHLVVPSGSRIRLDYGAGERPVLAARLQEMFGSAETPAIAGGRVKVLLHLLSPAGRPAAVTGDLGGFWHTGYAAVRADLRGRYPKHYWPDDPASAPATSRVRPRVPQP